MDIEFSNLTCNYPGRARVLDACCGRIQSGVCTYIVGPSGSGKTTLLRAIAGLEEGVSGSVHIGGRDMTGVPPHRRGLTMVLQDAPLHPDMSVEANLRFVLDSHARRARPRLSRHERRQVHGARVDEVVEILGLGACRARMPESLSGGERQRAALGRALVLDPPLHLWDEPLSDLDPDSRASIRHVLSELLGRGRTVVQVTHHIEPGMEFDAHVLVLRDGAVVQHGRLEDVRAQPIDAAVARLVAGQLA